MLDSGSPLGRANDFKSLKTLCLSGMLDSRQVLQETKPMQTRNDHEMMFEVVIYQTHGEPYGIAAHLRH